MSRKRTQRLNDFEHVLMRPGMYIGSTKNLRTNVYLYNDSTNKIISKTISDYNAGLLHIFKEILDNAVDNIQDSIAEGYEQTYIDITIDKETGMTSIKNDGKFIYAIKEDITYTDPITNKKTVTSLFPAETFFGYMRAGTNYDEESDYEHDSKGNLVYDDEGQPIPINGTKIGKNGIGSKATSIFSTKSIVEHTDTKHQKKLVITFENNLTKRSKPKVTACKSPKAYTKFTYYPDFEKFGIKGYSNNFIQMVKKMAYDVAFTSGIKVKFNGKLVKVNGLQKYAELFFSDSRKMLLFSGKANQKGRCDALIVEQTIEEAEEFGFRHISFANGNYTKEGGVHVNVNDDAIFKKMREWWNNKPKTKKDKDAPKVKKGDLEKFFFMFVVCTVKKPEFNAQTKFNLQGPVPPPAIVEPKMFNKMNKWDVVFYVDDMLANRLKRKIRRTENNKSGYVGGFGEKAADANCAGRAGKENCILYITEGNSAKGMVDNGITMLQNGQDHHGTFAIRGKFLNVTNATLSKINNNEEIQILKKIMGLHTGADYSDDAEFNTLRYQRKIVIVADADDDGIHIEGLLSNYFVRQHPELVKRGLIGKLKTPIIRMKKGKQIKYFFTKKKFERWLVKNEMSEENLKGWSAKYYKGLGTLDDDDVNYIFKEKLDYVVYTYKDSDLPVMDLGFNDKYANERKEWMMGNVYDRRRGDGELESEDEAFENEEIKSMSMTDFVNKVLINYHIENNDRSLPNVFDGFKESQRKIMYGCFLKKIFKQEYKVAQLGAYVAGNANYHHGEQNLPDTIVKMAQGFVGSNNIPLLINRGNFGSRHSAAKNNGAAAARYIYTLIDPIARHIFPEEDESLGVVDYTVDEGHRGEPVYYLPIIPMLLVNGSKGTGSGWSTTIPRYNPLDLVEWLRAHIRNKFDSGDNKYPTLLPWWRGFTGTVEEDGERTIISGKMRKHPKKKETFIIDELPVGMWTDNFKKVLDKLAMDKLIEKPSQNNGKNSVHFEIKCKSHFTLNIKNNMKCLVERKTFKNMVALDRYGVPTKYETPEDIMKEFFGVRYAAYVDRRKRKLAHLRENHRRAKAKHRYVVWVYNKKIDMRKFKNKEALVTWLRAPPKGIDPFLTEDEDHSFLTNIFITSMTQENIAKLQQNIKDIRGQHTALLKKKSWMIWLEELEVFEKEYNKFVVRREWGRGTKKKN